MIPEMVDNAETYDYAMKYINQLGIDVASKEINSYSREDWIAFINQ